MLQFVVVEPTTANSNNVGQFCVKSCVNNRFSFSPFLTSPVTLSTPTFTGCCQPGTLFQVTYFFGFIKEEEERKNLLQYFQICVTVKVGNLMKYYSGSILQIIGDNCV